MLSTDNLVFKRNISKRISATQLEKYLNRDNKGSVVLPDNDKFDANEDEEEREFIRQKIDLEIKNILEK